MSTDTARGESALRSEDHVFLRISRRAFESMGKFAYAHLFEDERLPRLAAEVLLYRNGRFQHIEEIFDQCAGHGWNASIYEAWAYVTAQNVRSMAPMLGPIAGEALFAYAKSQGVMEASRSEAIEAIEEALESLYEGRTGVLL